MIFYRTRVAPTQEESLRISKKDSRKPVDKTIALAQYPSMKLTDYLEHEGLRPGTFAVRLGVPASTIKRLIEAGNMPSKSLMLKIVEHTGGRVMPNDFLPGADNWQDAALSRSR